MRGFRLLEPNEIECRIAEIDKQGRYLSLLLYKTARTDMAKLDERFGMEGWANEYKMIGDMLFCGIGIPSEKKADGSWIWKWSNGTESNQDAEKGHASDAFKRAGFMLGIGTELYSAPRIKVSSDKCTIKEVNGKYRCYDNFEVGEIQYDADENISRLVILCNGNKCFSWEAQKKPVRYMCSKCGSIIVDYADANGRKIKAERHVNASLEKFGQCLCAECIKKMQAEEMQRIGDRAESMGVTVKYENAD